MKIIMLNYNGKNDDLLFVIKNKRKMIFIAKLALRNRGRCDFKFMELQSII